MTNEQFVSSRNNPGLHENDDLRTASFESNKARADVLEASRDTMIGRYGIAQPADGVVVVSLGEKRPIGVIRDLMKVATSFGGRSAIAANTLSDWATDERFTGKSSHDLTVSVQGVVPGTIGHRRVEVVHGGMADVGIAHLAAAHLAYTIVTRGEDLFRGYHVMAADGVLHNSPFGLAQYCGIYESGGHDCVAACRSWSPSRR